MTFVLLTISGAEVQKAKSVEENQATAQKEETARSGEGRRRAAESLRRGGAMMSRVAYERYSGFGSDQGGKEGRVEEEEVVTVQSLLKLTDWFTC